MIYAPGSQHVSRTVFGGGYIGGSKGRKSGRRPTTGLSTGLRPSRQKLCTGWWAHWAVCTTQRANIHVGLLNLLSTDAFSGVKMVEIRW